MKETTCDEGDIRRVVYRNGNTEGLGFGWRCGGRTAADVIARWGSVAG
jgi:hypothetical protein